MHVVIKILELKYLLTVSKDLMKVLEEFNRLDNARIDVGRE